MITFDYYQYRTYTFGFYMASWTCSGAMGGGGGNYRCLMGVGK